MVFHSNESPCSQFNLLIPVVKPFKENTKMTKFMKAVIKTEKNIHRDFVCLLDCSLILGFTNVFLMKEWVQYQSLNSIAFKSQVAEWTDYKRNNSIPKIMLRAFSTEICVFFLFFCFLLEKIFPTYTHTQNKMGQEMIF